MDFCISYCLKLKCKYKLLEKKLNLKDIPISVLLKTSALIGQLGKKLDLVLMHNVSFQFKNMVYPQILACTPKMGTQRVHVPSAENWSGHAGHLKGKTCMDSILIILKKKMAQGLHLPLYLDYFLQHLYIQQISGERLQDHWSSGFMLNSAEHINTEIFKIGINFRFRIAKPVIYCDNQC